MRQRCTDVNHPDYAFYGARGITMDPLWDSFVLFFEDMGSRPPGMTLDRKDNELGYGPTNCKWSTPKEQSNNQRRYLRTAERKREQGRAKSKLWRERRSAARIRGCPVEVEAPKGSPLHRYKKWG